ncbi:MAG: hypothetical protein CVU09_06765 [Bacteroidetes bacterium HGW-Bacteroidetes-4]|jgi:GLPGLI family protein|nr:MAG: hypothetical protein CVU09_06765 [Bacteroidetes bacterium HGW-Bacteroidetes-4]
MKRIVILFVLCAKLINAQEYINIDHSNYNCTYSYAFQQDSADKYSIKSQEMILQIGDRTSKFIHTHQFFVDSLSEVFKNVSPEAAFAQIWPQIQGNTIAPFCKLVIFKNYPDGKTITSTGYLSPNFYKITEEASLQWQIIPEKDTTLLGYTCHMATTWFAGRKYVAWFTLEIPISDGPYKFSGLPGLIIKIYDTRHQHDFELISLKKISWKQPILFIENAFVEISAKDYVKAFNVWLAQMYNKIEREDGITFADDETRIKASVRVKSRNNFIERY